MTYQFVELSNRELSAQIRAEMQTAERVETRRWNILGNCIHRAIVHNDVSWVNKGREMAQMYKSGMVNEYITLATTLVPFKFTKAEGWHGKIIKRKRDKWADTWQEELEKYVNALGEKHVAKNDKPPKFDEDKWLARTIAKAQKEGCLAQLIAKAQAANVKQALDPENQERVKKNEADHAEAVKVEEARRAAA